MKKKLFIFTNESIFFQDGKFFCDNIDLKSKASELLKLKYRPKIIIENKMILKKVLI